MSITTLSCGPARECGVATVTALEPGKAHHVLLFFSNSMWELYADGLLVQTYVYGGVYPLPATGAGAVGEAHATLMAVALAQRLVALETTTDLIHLGLLERELHDQVAQFARCVLSALEVEEAAEANEQRSLANLLEECPPCREQDYG